MGYALGALVLGFILYRLYRKGPSVAALTIAVDYFQILSLFASLQVPPPPRDTFCGGLFFLFIHCFTAHTYSPAYATALHFGSRRLQLQFVGWPPCFLLLS